MTRFTRAGVVGGGTMGTGIAYVMAAAGMVTTVVEPDASRVAMARSALAAAARGGVQRGKLDAESATALQSRIHWTQAVNALPEGLGVVVETVPERLDLKRRILAEIEGRNPGLLASNTSALSIDVLAGSLADPARFLGMHFFNPVWSLPLVELVCGAATSPSVLQQAQDLVSAIGKEAVVVQDVPGFATSRLDVIAALEAMRMLESGVASAEDIDRAVELAYRHPMGPLRLSDIVGLDVRLDISRVLESAYGERFAPPDILLDKVEAGELGKKTGKGFFDWP